MLCKVCGAQIPDEAAECEFCGAKTDNSVQSDMGDTKKIDIVEETQDNIEVEDEEAPKAEEIFDDNERRRRAQVKRMMEEKKQQLSEIERRRNEKRMKQRRNKIILISAICALAIAAVGIGIYYVAENINGSTTPSPSVQPTATPYTAAAVITPAPTALETVQPTVEPYREAESTTTTGGTNWTATGNTGSGSGTSSSGRGGSSSGSSSGGSTSSGGTSSGSSSSSGSSTSSGGTSSGGTSSGSGSSNVVNSGASSNNISAQLATGGEVIHNTGTGKLLMTFVVGNTKYYANVSEGSTTDQVKNKTYTITAQPTGEKYNGNTVYEITSLTKYDGKDYLLPNSGTKLLTSSDIAGMSKYDLALARNEIYARHGRKFQTAEYNDYFSSKSWYSINPNYNYSDDDSNLNEIEIKNVQFILNAERN